MTDHPTPPTTAKSATVHNEHECLDGEDYGNNDDKDDSDDDSEEKSSKEDKDGGIDHKGNKTNSYPDGDDDDSDNSNDNTEEKLSEEGEDGSIEETYGYPGALVNAWNESCNKVNRIFF
jgi:hypothetical protein